MCEYECGYACGGWRALGVGECSSSEERKETNVVEATTDQKSCISEETKVEFDKPEFLPHKAGKEWAASAPHLGFRGAAIMKLRPPPKGCYKWDGKTQKHTQAQECSSMPTQHPLSPPESPSTCPLERPPHALPPPCSQRQRPHPLPGAWSVCILQPLAKVTRSARGV